MYPSKNKTKIATSRSLISQKSTILESNMGVCQSCTTTSYCSKNHNNVSTNESPEDISNALPTLDKVTPTQTKHKQTQQTNRVHGVSCAPNPDQLTKSISCDPRDPVRPNTDKSCRQANTVLCEAALSKATKRKVDVIVPKTCLAECSKRQKLANTSTQHTFTDVVSQRKDIQNRRDQGPLSLASESQERIATTVSVTPTRDSPLSSSVSVAKHEQPVPETIATQRRVRFEPEAAASTCSEPDLSSEESLELKLSSLCVSKQQALSSEGELKPCSHESSSNSSMDNNPMICCPESTNADSVRNNSPTLTTATKIRTRSTSTTALRRPSKTSVLSTSSTTTTSRVSMRNTTKPVQRVPKHLNRRSCIAKGPPVLQKQPNRANRSHVPQSDQPSRRRKPRSSTKQRQNDKFRTKSLHKKICTQSIQTNRSRLSASTIHHVHGISDSSNQATASQTGTQYVRTTHKTNTQTHPPRCADISKSGRALSKSHRLVREKIREMRQQRMKQL